MLADKRGYYAGYPLPCDSSLVVSPRFPLQSMQGFSVENDDDSPESRQETATRNTYVVRQMAQWLSSRKLSPETDLEVVNSWQRPDGAAVLVVRDMTTNKRYGYVSRESPVHSRLNLLLKTLGVSLQVHSVATERQALRKLKQLIRPHMYETYLLTGTFLESSPRSGLIYVFRRLRPVLALTTDRATASVKPLAALCMHPLGYYAGSFVGAMTPTDDVVAQLLMMRADERRFWAQCGQHRPDSPVAGL